MSPCHRNAAQNERQSRGIYNKRFWKVIRRPTIGLNNDTIEDWSERQNHSTQNMQLKWEE